VQAFGNIATDPILRVSKKTNKGYWEFRLCENQGGQRALTQDPTWYTVRLMSQDNPGLGRGDFVKATGRLKADSYLNREGKPASGLLILAFEAVRLKSADELKAVREAKQQEEKKEPVPG
jgi:single-strand DNA-binding protein